VLLSHIDFEWDGPSCLLPGVVLLAKLSTFWELFLSVCLWLYRIKASSFEHTCCLDTENLIILPKELFGTNISTIWCLQFFQNIWCKNCFAYQLYFLILLWSNLRDMLASVLLADWMKLCAGIVVVCILSLFSPELMFMFVQSMAACFRLQNVRMFTSYWSVVHAIISV
jgi:hypothetical protein